MESKYYDLEASIVRHLMEVEAKYPELERVFGKDFNSLLYRTDIERIIKEQIMPLLGFKDNARDCLDRDHWAERHPFNFPGPFYTGESDTCGTGDVEAPMNVIYDSHACEYVFCQPKDYMELICVIDAAAVEVLDSYSVNGNTRWTIDLCRQWWREKPYLIECLNDPELIKVNGGRQQFYVHYLNTYAELDLRKYCFFLDNGRYPLSIDATLPEI